MTSDAPLARLTLFWSDDPYPLHSPALATGNQILRLGTVEGFIERLPLGDALLAVRPIGSILAIELSADGFDIDGVD